MRFNYSFLNVFTSSDLAARRLALMRAETRVAKPVVWLTGCIHGDEVGGMVVIHQVFKRLRKSPLLKGSICAFPLLNPFGFETASRSLNISEEDLNRSFPGNPSGSFAERIANRILTNISKTNPDLVLDLHNDQTASIPYVLLEPKAVVGNDNSYEKALAISRQTGLLVIHESEEEYESDDYDKSLSTTLLQRGVPTLTMELGEAYLVNEKNVADGVCAIWRMLSSLEMVTPATENFNFQIPAEYRGKTLKYFHQHVGSATGVAIFLVKPGDVVRKGEPIAKVYNVFGKLLETVRGEREGVVLDHSEVSVALPGVPTMAFGVQM